MILCVLILVWMHFCIIWGVGVYGLVGLVDRSWLKGALCNNTVSGGIYRYLWGKGSLQV